MIDCGGTPSVDPDVQLKMGTRTAVLLTGELVGLKPQRFQSRQPPQLFRDGTLSEKNKQRWVRHGVQPTQEASSLISLVPVQGSVATVQRFVR